MVAHEFCTYFDRNYLLKGLTLYRSLLNVLPEFTLHVLCLDEETHRLIEGLHLPNVSLIHLNEMEKVYPELLKAKINRKMIEYYFTLTPFLPSFILKNDPSLKMVTYVDADLFFYSDPQPIYDELGENSVLIIPHRFPPQLQHLGSYGKFNVQLIVYRNDTPGNACLKRYREQCIEWCFDRYEGNRFADQKYLDDWPDFFKKVTVLRHKGAGLAPWNWMQYDIKIQQNTAVIDQEPLIFYHFHALKFLAPCLVNHGLATYNKIMPSHLKNFFYLNYAKQLKQTQSWIKSKTALNQSTASSDIRFQVKINRRQLLAEFSKGNLMLLWPY